jgi:RNA polymerase-binding transcription factor DksA
MEADDVVRDRLTEERGRLQGIKDELGTSRGDEGHHEQKEELSSSIQHPADIGTETFDREKDLTILDSIEGELADVEHALQRLDAGTYGTCEACGRPIGDDRLEAMPATRYCLHDQAAAENELRTSTPREIPQEESAT